MRSSTCHKCEKTLANNEIINNQRAGAPTPDGEIDYDYCWNCFAAVYNIGFTEETFEMEEHNDKVPGYACKVCGKEYQQRRSLQKHNKTHEGHTFMCGYCGKEFQHEASLRQHEQEHSKFAFICSMCGKGFPTKFRMERHVMSHTGEKPYMCTTCGKGFIQKATLQEHERIHSGDKPFQCSKCDKRFTQRSHLRVHEKKNHPQFTDNGLVSSLV